MKLRTLATTGFALLGSASAAISSPQPASSDDMLVPVSAEDLRTDAERTFVRVDTNNDGAIDVDEYAAQELVYAELARFNRFVTVDGEDLTIIPVNAAVPENVPLFERTRITSSARREFYAHAGDDGRLTKDEWQAKREEEVSWIDRNGNGIVAGSELRQYSMMVAQTRSAGI